MEVNITADDTVKKIVKLGIIQFTRLRVSSKNDLLMADLEILSSELRDRYQSPSDAMDRLNVTRSLYRKIGLDPTKTRPSSEALLRRVLKGIPLYQINSLVDTCNYCSLQLLLSLGLYDVSKIVGNVQLRLGKENEGYEGIRKEFINVHERLTLADELGPFGNPSADSARTMITEKTTGALFVIFMPADYPTDELQRNVAFIEESVKRYHDCEILMKGLK
jgi:DNA/RNA-binding domain of Phe-tRNA-synthetase-like protein